MAEIILRLGCALVAWLVVFAHGILLAVVPFADCSTSLWGATLLFAALAGLGTLALPLGLSWRTSLRWIALPALPLALWGGWVALRLWDGVGGAALCDVLAGTSPSATGTHWERVWAPLQLAVCIAWGAQAARFWRPAPAAPAR